MNENVYILDLNALQIGDYEYHYLLDDAFFAALDENEIHGGSLDATVALEVRELGCKLHLHVQGNVTITCDRCLEDMSQPIEVEESLLVKVGQEPTEGADDETIYVDPQSGELDLAWLLFEMIEINLPIVHSHQAGACNPLMEELLQTHLCTSSEEPEEE